MKKPAAAGCSKGKGVARTATKKPAAASSKAKGASRLASTKKPAAASESSSAKRAPKVAVAPGRFETVFLLVKRHWRKAPPRIITTTFTKETRNTRSAMYGFEASVLGVYLTEAAANAALHSGILKQSHKRGRMPQLSVQARQVRDSGVAQQAHVWIVTSSIWEEFFGEDESDDDGAPRGYPLNRGMMGGKPGVVLGVFNSLQGANDYAAGQGYRVFDPNGLFGRLQDFIAPVTYPGGLANIEVGHGGGDGFYDGQVRVSRHKILA
eukprot:TRINITY_DN123407_c0_g1_i1.p1 TRINITY_DN123407_c0_g1~~TRINITY_DN123407_c0_g1_i1.p1  ORF type:complete len:266 (-),score=32.05 TRINITY_DN123407_c0_g1_i1:60-857(-)